MATIDISTDVGKLRLNIADYVDPVVFPDATLQEIIDQNSGNMEAATKQAAGYMLGYLSRQSTVRLDRIQLMGSEAFNNYLKYLDKVINNTASGMFATAGIYVGGVYTQDFIDNLNDATVIQKRIPSYGDGCSITDIDLSF